VVQRTRWVVAVGLMLGLVLVLGPGSAFAQITTGNVFGTVKDTQGGVLPGATVVLTSQTRGTKLAPVVTKRKRGISWCRTSPRTPTPSK